MVLILVHLIGLFTIVNGWKFRVLDSGSYSLDATFTANNDAKSITVINTLNLKEAATTRGTVY